MGWGDCGNDSQGRPIGYNFEATCDHPDCNTEIDRGLAYACGGMHGEMPGCEKYFCYEHLFFSPETKEFLCEECCNLYGEEKETQK